MILGQLIQAGRRFCECRSNDFIPESDERLVLISYSIRDRVYARSIGAQDEEFASFARRWLDATHAVGYLLIRRHPRELQRELPAPVGRSPMDRITMVAAIGHEIGQSTFYLQKGSVPGAYRLIEARSERTSERYARINLLRAEPELGPPAEPAPRRGSALELDLLIA